MQHIHQLASRFAPGTAKAPWLICCALLMLTATTAAQAQTPINPLRSTATRSGKVLLDSSVRPAQGVESLPDPLRRAPAEPELAAPSAPPQPAPLQPLAPRGVSSVLTPQSQIITDDPAATWPAEAPAEQHYLPRHGHPFSNDPYEPRDPWFSHTDPNDPGRHTGWGDPLTSTSWLNRPWYFGLFIGGMLADDLIEDHVAQANAPFLGFRLGHDFDHFWGWEGRYAFARTEIFNGAGVPLAEPARDYFVDVNLLYYPWGDSRWRPYLLAGIGFTNFRFVDDTHHWIDDTPLTIPLGFGLKHYYSPWFTLRFDFVDNISMSTGQLDSMHNFSLMAGVEFRFGGARPSYFPWTGNTSYW